jgi:two-component system chemotaxis response regulator CheY
MTVLLVDDSRIMRNIIKNALHAHPKFQTVTYLEAGDGLDALSIIESKRVDLLLLDWNMPGLNGLELVKRLRDRAEFSGLPIIMVTSEAAKYNVIEAVKAGVNDYLVKPVSEKSLIEKIERLSL